MTEQEARQILGVSEQTSWEEILQVQTTPPPPLPSSSYPLYISIPPLVPSISNSVLANNNACGSF